MLLLLPALCLGLVLSSVHGSPVAPSQDQADQAPDHVDQAPDQDDLSKNWEMVSGFTLSNRVPVVKYKSLRSGMVVVLAKVNTPIIDSMFCLATEAKDDNGLPHTLEHLIFQGSDEYPYTNFLDLAAARSLGGKMNAFTARDQTCYIISAAGHEGFSSIASNYLNSVFFPVLTDGNFVTEVHHINERGENAGVVYSEMQGVENKAGTIVYNTLMHEIYPPGGSSYESITGGKLSNLRQNTTNELIRQYHHDNYQLKNTYINIVGDMSAEQIFQMLKPLEDKFLNKEVLPAYTRPFQTEYPTLRKDVDRVIQYPSSNEKLGKARLAWRLPYNLWENLREMRALSLLTAYLTWYSTSPMDEAFVNIDEPLATSVYLYNVEYSQPGVVFGADNVPVDKLELVEEKFFETVDKIVADGPDKFDLKRIKMIVMKVQSDTKESMENNPADILHSILADQVYGHKPEDLQSFLARGQDDEVEYFLNQKPQFWLDLLDRVFHCHRVKILAYPSKALDEQLKQEEKERLAEQKAKLGEEGIKAAGLHVKAALEKATKTPNEALLTVPMASTDAITFRPLTHYNYTTEEQTKAFDLKSIPYKFYVDQISSQYVRAYLFHSIAEISPANREYLPLLKSVWMESPLNVDGKVQTKEEVNNRHLETVISLYNSLGYNELFTFGVQMEMEKYDEAVQLLKDTIHHVQFTAKDTLTVAKKLKSKIPAKKQSGYTVASTLASMIYYSDKALVSSSNFYEQESFLEKVISDLETDPDSVLAKLNELKDQLIRPTNTVGYLATDTVRLEKAQGQQHACKVWKNLFDADKNEFPQKEELEEPISVEPAYKFRDPSPEHRHLIASVSGSESCFVSQNVPYDNTNLECPDQAVVQVMLKYMSKVLYEHIRGKGLAYGVWLTVSPNAGKLSAGFYRSSQLVEGYNLYREILTNYSSPSSSWDPILLDSYRGEEIFNTATREQSLSGLVGQAVNSLLTDVDDQFYNRRFVKKLSNVTIEKVKAAGMKYLPQLLDPDLVVSGVACGADQVEKAREMFAGHGFNMKDFKNE